MPCWPEHIGQRRRAQAMFVALLAAFWMTGCSDTVEPEDPCPDDSFVNYENFGAPLMLTWCVPCHSSHLEASERQSATIGVDFDTYEGVTLHLDRIYLRAVEAFEDGSSAMPPAGGTTAADRVLLQEWIDCGAPL